MDSIPYKKTQSNRIDMKQNPTFCYIQEKHFSNKDRVKDWKNLGESISLIKRKIHQDDISNLNLCDPNTRIPTFTKGTLLKLRPHINAGRLEQTYHKLPGQPDRY